MAASCLVLVQAGKNPQASVLAEYNPDKTLDAELTNQVIQGSGLVG